MYTSADILFRWKYTESEKHKRGQNEIYVTDLLYCGYKLLLEQKFPEILFSDPFNPVTLEGDLIHRGVQSILKEIYGDRIQIEVEKTGKIGDITLKGRIDAILDGKHGIEIKHAKGDYNIPHKHHILQAKIYKWLFNLESIELLYITRDRITSITVDGTITDSEINKLVQNPPIADEAWLCQYCSFNFACDKKLTGKQRMEQQIELL